MKIGILSFYYLATLVICLTDIVAQEINIKIAGVTIENATLLELEGEKLSKIDSVILHEGKYQFSISRNL